LYVCVEIIVDGLRLHDRLRGAGRNWQKNSPFYPASINNSEAMQICLDYVVSLLVCFRSCCIYADGVLDHVASRICPLGHERRARGARTDICTLYILVRNRGKLKFQSSVDKFMDHSKALWLCTGLSKVARPICCSVTSTTPNFLLQRM